MAKATVAVIEYGMGNIRSVMNALDEIGAKGELVADPERIGSFDKVILPGVGAFQEAMESLKNHGMDEALGDFVNAGRPLLGICLGMQLVCRNSEENGNHDGLGWINAEVRSFPRGQGLKVPHMGWNAIRFVKDDPLFKGLESRLDVYFVHSYRVESKSSENVLAQTDYGGMFTSIVRQDNIWGMQFHPEKSQATGLKLLQNFTSV